MANNRPVSYLQTDKRWGNKSYSTKYENTTIARSGCGPTAMAMVIATWVDPSVTPVTTCDWSLKHGYKATNNGTYHSYFVPQAKAYGLECEKLNESSLKYFNRAQSMPYHQKAHDAVDEGHMVICLMGPGNWTTGGHYITWYDNDGDYVLINDPASTKKTRERNTWELLMQQVRFYWVVKVPKEVISMTNSDIKKLIAEEVAKNNKEVAVAAVKEYLGSLMGSEQSDWSAKEGSWDKACKKGVFDGTNPKMYPTREQIAAVIDRIGLLDPLPDKT